MKNHSLWNLAFLFLFLLPHLIFAQVASPDVPIPGLAAGDELPELPPGPLMLTSIKPEMFSPDYWIDRMPEPDRILKTPEELKRFNEDILNMNIDRTDVLHLEASRPGKPIHDQIQLEYKAVRGRLLFDIEGNEIPKTFFDRNIEPLIQLANVPERIRHRWGAAIRPTSVRALPTDVKMLEEIGDIEFDQLQFTLIKLWTPVAILHESSDGRWFYLSAPYARGWVKARDIALFDSRDDLEKYAAAKKFLTVTGESVPIFSNPEMTEPLQNPSMGTFLPVSGIFGTEVSPEIAKLQRDLGKPVAERKSKKAYVIWMPVRGKGGKTSVTKAYVNARSDIYEGFLPYTQRNVIKQAFKLLGARYGWGGMYYGRDCSGFTHDVFLPFGIDMPRGSKQQAFVGTQINHFEPMRDPEGKAAAIRAGLPGITLLRMPMHQMLYLGEVNGQFYAIHCTWAERYSKTSDAKNRINQVVVSDLTLNGQSYLGSLFDRIITVSEIN